MAKNDDSAKVGTDQAADRVRRLLSLGASTAPLMATFALSTLTIEKAAAASNATSSKAF